MPIYLEFTAEGLVATGDGLIVYTAPDDPDLLTPDTVPWYAVGFVYTIWHVSCIPAPEQLERPATVIGCDALLPIPSTAVVGSFVSDALAYWQPGKLTNPLVTIEAGNTA